MEYLFDMFKENKSFYKLVIWNIIIYSISIYFYLSIPNMKNLNDFYKFGLDVTSRAEANKGAGIIVLFIGTIILTGFTTIIAYRRFKLAKKNNNLSVKKSSFVLFILFLILTYTLSFFVLKIF